MLSDVTVPRYPDLPYFICLQNTVESCGTKYRVMVLGIYGSIAEGRLHHIFRVV
jgi:hypothetical protein